MNRRLSSAHAFTLIELLVVILVIGILIAVAAPSFLGQTEKAHDSAAKQNLAVAYKAAKSSTIKVINQGSFDATEVMNEINTSEGGRLNATLGDCPTDATADINDIIVDSSYTGGTNLLICNDPDRKIWYLQVIAGVLQPMAYVGEGDEVPGDAGAGGQVFTIGTPTQVMDTAANAYPGSPDWGPTIAYVDESAGNNNIFSVETDGAPVVQLTSGSDAEDAPKWSPDGSKIVYRIMTGTPEIGVMNANGSGQVNLTGDDIDGDESPSWSPTGDKIVYVKSGANASLWTMDPDGTGKTEINLGVPTLIAQPQFSPDGTKFAFGCTYGGPGSGACVADADGSNITRVFYTAEPGGRDPAWLDNNTIIQVASFNVTVGAADGSSSETIYTLTDSNNTNLSPDGSALALMINGDVWVMNSDATELTQVTNTAVDEESPAWSPDSQSLVFKRWDSVGDEPELFIVSVR